MQQLQSVTPAACSNNNHTLFAQSISHAHTPQGLLAHIATAANKDPSSLFDFCFIDEAGQATAPEALIPLTLCKVGYRKRLLTFYYNTVVKFEVTALWPLPTSSH